MSGTPVFTVAAQDTPSNHLDLVAITAYVHRSHRTITNGKQFLTGYLPSSQHRRSKLKHTPSLSVKKAYYLIFIAVA